MNPVRGRGSFKRANRNDMMFNAAMLLSVILGLEAEASYL